MDKTRVLVIRYDNRLPQSEIPLFRGAVIASMEGSADIMYHNHCGDSLVYRYPLIQYKRLRQCAAIVAVDSGADVIGQFLSSAVTSLKIGEREEEFSIADIKANRILVQVWDGEFEYRLTKWLPLNSRNFAEYVKLDSLSDKVAFLERILTGNILSFAKGIGVTLTSPLMCRIVSLGRQSLLTYKGVKMMAFDLEFKSNVSIPDYVGLGKGVSLGFGVVSRKHSSESQKE